MLILDAAKAVADAIKFQWFKYDHLATTDYEGYNAYRTLFIKECDWANTIGFAKGQGLQIWIDVFDDLIFIRST